MIGIMTVPDRNRLATYRAYKTVRSAIITCANCQHLQTIKSRIVGPASMATIKKCCIEVDKVSRDEMRTLVCAQGRGECSVEPGTARRFLPWDRPTEDVSPL